MLSGLDFAVAYLDDILLKSKNPEELKKNVFEVFRRIQTYPQKIVNLWKTRPLLLYERKKRFKKMLCNTVRELPVRLEEIENKVLDDNFIVEAKKKLKGRSVIKSEVYSICNDVLVFSERVVILLSLQKRNLKKIPHRTSWYIQNEKLNEKLCVLA